MRKKLAGRTGREQAAGKRDVGDGERSVATPVSTLLGAGGSPFFLADWCDTPSTTVAGAEHL